MSNRSTAFDWRPHLKDTLQKNQNDPHHRFIQMATVTQRGEPRNRTVVFRGFDDDQESLLICTDSRSQKFRELTHRQSVELCWYFLQSREQYRLNGTVQFVQQPHKIQQIWSSLSTSSKAQFYWPTPGEAVIDSQKALSESATKLAEKLRAPNIQPSDLEKSPYPSNFVVIKASFNSVDYLSLVGSYQRLICHRTAIGWESKAVYP